MTTPRTWRCSTNKQGGSAPCKRTSNTSMLVTAVDIRIDGDLWDQDNNGSRTARFTRLRTVYSVTISRLSWMNEDLAQALSAECESKGECEGQRFKRQPNSSSSDYLVVGKNSLPLTELSPFAPTGHTKWRSLVSGANSLGQQGFDVLLQRRFSQVTANGSALKSTPVNQCNAYVDDFVNTVEKNHLYMERSLQISYIAAFYFLFQNAVRHKALDSSSKESRFSSAISLAFTGNLQFMDVQVSIPTTNAIVSLVGCVVLLLTSLGIYFRAKRSEHVLKERANGHVITEAMMNTTKYPPLLLQMGLNGTAMHENFPLALHNFRVQQVHLQDNQQNKVVLGGGAQ